MTESSTLIDKLCDRIELKIEYLNKEKSFSDLERAAWGQALEWCRNTVCVLIESDIPDVPEMPEGLECDECGD